MPTIDRPELFLIPHETVEALSIEEVEASYRDMEELGIAKLPYTLTDIGIDLGDFSDMPDINLSPLKSSGAAWSKVSSWEIRISFIDDEIFDILLKGEEDVFKSIYASPLSFPRIDTEKTRLGFARMAERVRKALIVLLATKNIIKTRVENKLWKFGIGRKKQSHRYVTTITIPPTANLSPNQGRTGITMRPHLRRGHIRRQRYGPKLVFVQKVWIEPCFINADPDFISSRTAYNTSVNNTV